MQKAAYYVISVIWPSCKERIIRTGEAGTSVISRKRKRRRPLTSKLTFQKFHSDSAWLLMNQHLPHTCHMWLQGEQGGLFYVVNVPSELGGHFHKKKGRVSKKDNQQTLAMRCQQRIWGPCFPKTFLLLQAISQKLIIC